MYQTINNSTGSLKVGTSAPRAWKVGDVFYVGPKEYKVSYVMGREAKTHVCCKGYGPLPVGKVVYSFKVKK